MRTSPTSPSSAAAPMPASCTTATTISPCATAICCCSMRAVSTTTTPRISPAPFPSAADSRAVQRAVYEVVLEAQLAAIDKVRSGNHWNHPHEAAVRVVTQGLVKLGLLKGQAAEADQGPGLPAVFQSSHRPLARASTCMMSATTRSAANGGCWNRGWCSPSSRGSTSDPRRASRRNSGTSAFASRMKCW